MGVDERRTDGRFLQRVAEAVEELAREVSAWRDEAPPAIAPPPSGTVDHTDWTWDRIRAIQAWADALSRQRQERLDRLAAILEPLAQEARAVAGNERE